MVLPSWAPTSWQRLHAADSSTTQAKSSSELTSVPKTGVRGELCVASNHEVQIDGLVHTCEHSPHEVLHHGVIFVLTTTVVSMQTGGGFAEAIMHKKDVQHTDNCVRPLPCITGLINK